MTIIVLLVFASLTMGAIGLGIFLWTLSASQYDDLDGASVRIFLENDDNEPL